MSISGIVFPFNQTNFSALLGTSAQANYICQYLSDLKAKTCLIEKNYIDKNYLIDYQKFYSRSFEPIERFTNRIHFFSEDFSVEKFDQMLESNNTGILEKSYLGFVVSRPIKDSDGNPLVGRTILQTYPTKTNGRKRFYITVDHNVSLYGVDLKVKSIPFQAQDQGVSACATIALWTTFQSLVRAFDVQERSPAEITEMATLFPSQSRVFPQSGLTLNQMITCIRATNLDVEIVNAADNEVITTAVKAYTFAGLPLIGTLRLSKGASEDHHAVVIDGYQYDDKGNVTELYVHDDQIGPYSRVQPNITFESWKNAWSDLGYQVEIERLLIPVYHKIRLPFYSIYHHYVSKKQEVDQGDITLDLLLTTIQRYKNFLIQRQIREKSKNLQRNLPRFIWIERTFEKGNKEPIQDDIFDGTAIHCTKLASIDYQ